MEMLKTFNCGVGFCIIVESKNLNKIKKYFTKNFQPYVIGKIVKGKKDIYLNGKIEW
jgi:phosphoribosylaminoimidazole (AIR) synthetase